MSRDRAIALQPGYQERNSVSKKKKKKSRSMGSLFAQAGLKLLASSDPPVLTFPKVGGLQV